MGSVTVLHSLLGLVSPSFTLITTKLLIFVRRSQCTENVDFLEEERRRQLTTGENRGASLTALLIKSNSNLGWTVKATSQPRVDDNSRHVAQGIGEDKIQAEPEQPDGLRQLPHPDEHLLLSLLLVHLGVPLGQRENSLVVAALLLLGDLLAGEHLSGVDQEERGQAGAVGR